MKTISRLLVCVFLTTSMWATAADFSKKYQCTIGSGEDPNTVSLTMNWHNDLAIDNLSLLVKLPANTTVGAMMNLVPALDDRFYTLESGGSVVAYGFDTNGDHSRALQKTVTTTISSETEGEEPTEQKVSTDLKMVDGKVTVSADDLQYVTNPNQFDHWMVNNSENEWKIFVNDHAANYSTTLNDGDNVVLEYCPVATAFPSGGTLFYLRDANTIGLWLPEELNLSTGNGKSVKVPSLATLGNRSELIPTAALRFEVKDETGEADSRAVSVSLVYNNLDNRTATITIGSPDKAIIKPYVMVGEAYSSATKYYGSDSKVTIEVANPVTGIGIDGFNPGETIELDNMGVLVITPVYTPASPDFLGYIADFGDENIVSIYKNVNSLVAHRAGTTTLTIKSLDGRVSSTYNVTVKGIEPENVPGDYTHGMVWLNEEWYGHTSGSLNYIDEDGKIYYRAYGNVNDNKAFGATSQFGMNYAGKYVIMSKQAWDHGDTRDKTGGRVVVFDAETFKHIGAIDEIGGDGRACVGVNPSKVYLGTTKGVRVMNLDKVTVAESDIPLGEYAWPRNGQIGNMVKAGKYVFASLLNSNSGEVLVFDAEKDTFVKNIPVGALQGIVQTADGTIWAGLSKQLVAIDPETLEAAEPIDIPGSITCSSGSWRSVNMLAPHNSNTLIWGTGTFYRWDIDKVDDPLTLTPVFTHASKIDDPDNEGSQLTVGGGYGSPGYDEDTDTYMFASMPGFGTDALNNWYHFIDGTTGEVKKRIKLPLYWWFPAMPINVDRHAPEIHLGNLTFNTQGEAGTWDLADYVEDKDNHNCNINITVEDAPVAARATAAAEWKLDGKRLTITPLAQGELPLVLTAESNGKTTAKKITVAVGDTLTGVESTAAARNFSVFSVAGVRVASFTGRNANDVRSLGLEPAVYIVRSENGETYKYILK